MEQGAFLFLKFSPDSACMTFEVADVRMLGSADYVHQECDGLELTDATHASLIKHAHDIGASLAEAHSHRGPWPARFSCIDMAGLRETVPHMWWRLRKRPYIALVFTPASGFDALVWLDSPTIPRSLDALVVGSSHQARLGCHCETGNGATL